MKINREHLSYDARFLIGSGRGIVRATLGWANTWAQSSTIVSLPFTDERLISCAITLIGQLDPETPYNETQINIYSASGRTQCFGWNFSQSPGCNMGIGVGTIILELIDAPPTVRVTLEWSAQPFLKRHTKTVTWNVQPKEPVNESKETAEPRGTYSNVEGGVQRE